jgi:hypothetical protein
METVSAMNQGLMRFFAGGAKSMVGESADIGEKQGNQIRTSPLNFKYPTVFDACIQL